MRSWPSTWKIPSPSAPLPALRCVYSPPKLILKDSIKSLSEATWEALQHLILDYAAKTKIETGKRVRIDSTAIETNIHQPTDSSLLRETEYGHKT